MQSDRKRYSVDPKHEDCTQCKYFERQVTVQINKNDDCHYRIQQLKKSVSHLTQQFAEQETENETLRRQLELLQQNFKTQEENESSILGIEEKHVEESDNSEDSPHLQADREEVLKGLQDESAVENTVKDLSSFLEIQMKEELTESCDLIAKGPIDSQSLEDTVTDATDETKKLRTCMWMVLDGKGQPTSCGKELPTAKDLVSHFDCEHLKTAGNVCFWEGCKRNQFPFTNKSYLISHFRGNHSGEKPFTCPHKGCARTFSEQSELRLHAKIHPYPCTYPGCRKVFSQERTMLLHNRVQHKGEGGFKCPFEDCGMVFNGAVELRRHSHRHEGTKPHVCRFPRCQLSFASKERRDEHFAQHREDGADECPFEGCGKRFAKAYMLQRHERTHTGEKPFTCPHEGCGKTFSLVSNMKSHVLKWHAKSTL